MGAMMGSTWATIAPISTPDAFASAFAAAALATSFFFEPKTCETIFSPSFSSMSSSFFGARPWWCPSALSSDLAPSLSLAFAARPPTMAGTATATAARATPSSTPIFFAMSPIGIRLMRLLRSSMHVLLHSTGRLARTRVETSSYCLQRLST